jgi:hypothetical protein
MIAEKEVVDGRRSPMSEKIGKAAVAGWGMKLLIVVACAASMFFAIAADAPEDQTDEEKGPTLLPSAIFTRSVEMLKSSPLPVVASAGFGPAAPGPRTPVTVSVAIGNAKSNVKAKITRVGVFHSADGGRSWGETQLAFDAADSTKWSGKLPGRGRGASVLVSFDASNESGGNLIEPACMQRKWPPSDSYTKSDCGQEAGAAVFEACLKNRRPRGCMFQSGAEAPPVDDLPSRAGDDLDLLSFRVGFDDSYLYFDLTVQREISAGSLTPIALNQYTVMIFDPASKNPEPKAGLPLDGVMARFLPIGLESPDFIAPCAAVLNRGDKVVQDTIAVVCAADGQHLFMKVKRNLWGKSFPKELIVFAHTGILRERNFDQFSFVDVTGMTRVRLGARKYAVSR